MPIRPKQESRAAPARAGAVSRGGGDETPCKETAPAMNELEAASEPASPAAEEAIRWAVEWLRLGVETVGAALVGIGVVVALVQLVRGSLGRERSAFTATRLTLARYLALALEFQLGADILSTAIAPSWQQIGKLAAIAVIRTGLNFFLSREMQEEQRLRAAEEATDG
jgi:uncharacterized membrane protein